MEDRNESLEETVKLLSDFIAQLNGMLSEAAKLQTKDIFTQQAIIMKLLRMRVEFNEMLDDNLSWLESEK